MTQHWDILDNGHLAVWTHDLDPDTDSPAKTSNSTGFDWGDNPPDEVFDLLWDSAVDYFNSVGTIDFWLIQLIAEVAFEQIERR